MVALAPRALALIDIKPDAAEEDDFVQYFAGNKALPGAEPAAHCYAGGWRCDAAWRRESGRTEFSVHGAGHQFGNFAGQLGDGAAMYLGEVLNG